MLIQPAPTFRYTALAWELPKPLGWVAMQLEGEELQQFLARELPRHGRPLWRRRASNLVTDDGARWLISHGWVAAKASIAWYLMPKGVGTLTNAHTMASHPGWAEVAAYSQTTRPVLTIVAPAAGRSGNNSASLAAITANSSTTVAGVCLTSSNAKNGTTGTLYGGADFANPRALTSGQILQISATVSF